VSAKFEMEVALDNAAFATPTERRDELARLLRQAADGVAAGKSNVLVMDLNGNKVGQWDYDPVEEEECPECGALNPPGDACWQCGQ
jgi:hypothetical protein